MSFVGLSPILPASLEVVFRTRRCNGNPGDTVPQFYTKTVLLSSITLTNTAITPKPDGTTGATLPVRSEALGLFHVGGANPTNQAALDALATQIAQDWYDWQSASFDRVYNGVIAPDMSGLADEIVWAYDAIPAVSGPGDSAADGAAEDGYSRIVANVTTRVRTMPYTGQPEELQQLDPACASCTDANNSGTPVTYTPCAEYYGPPATCTGGGGKATATISGGGVTGYSVTSGGTYTSTPTVAISGDGTGATATATVSGGALTGITPGAAGTGYSYAIVSLNGGGAKPQVTRYKLCIEDGRLVARFVSYDTVQ